MRIVVAAVLGILAFFLLLLLGESQKGTLVLIASMGAYFLLAMFLLSLGTASRVRRGLSLLALNAALVIASVIAVLVEPNRVAALQAVGLAAFGVACSFVGWGLASWLPRRAPRTDS
jgi:hypothetical protein